MIFVFGSNLAGIHGAGAAKYAKQYRGAISGQGIGLQNQSYAIPTKDEHIQSLPLELITQHVYTFISFAREHSIPNPKSLSFQITRIGCGLAGFTDDQIAPMFASAPSNNCFFDANWRPYLGSQFEYWGRHA